MKEVCWAGLRLPIISVTVNFGLTKYPVSDDSSEQNRRHTYTEAHRSDGVAEEHERKNQRSRIQRRRGDHQSGVYERSARLGPSLGLMIAAQSARTRR